MSADLRMFGVDLSVYNKTVNGQPTFSEFRLLCVIPNSPRWKNYKRLPVLHGYVQVTGEVIGLYQVESRRSLCILISDLSFLTALSNTQNSTITSTASPAETPRKRLRRRGEPSLQQTPSKRPRQESPARDSSPSWQQNPAQPEDEEDKEDVIVSSSCTEHTNEVDDLLNAQPRGPARRRKKARN
jgi:hypothetical protein